MKATVFVVYFQISIQYLEVICVYTSSTSRYGFSTATCINHEDIHLLNWLMFYSSGQTPAKVKLADFGVSGNLDDNTNSMMHDTILNLDYIIGVNSDKSKLTGCSYVYESVEQIASEIFKIKFGRLIQDESNFNIYLPIYEVELTEFLNKDKNLAKILAPLLIIHSDTRHNPFKNIKPPNAVEIVKAIVANCDYQPFRALSIQA